MHFFNLDNIPMVWDCTWWCYLFVKKDGAVRIKKKIGNLPVNLPTGNLVNW